MSRRPRKPRRTHPVETGDRPHLQARSRESPRGSGSPSSAFLGRQPDPADGFSYREWVFWAGLLLLAFASLATWLQFDFGDVMGYYSMFADGILKGRLYIDVQPEQVQLMDMIAYEGRYYLQWGPAPGLFHFLAKMLGANLSDRVACILSGWLASLLFLGIILTFRRRYFPRLPKWVCIVSFGTFALGSPAALVVLRPTIYDECIAVASVAVLFGFLAFLRFQERPSLLAALLCGLGVTLAFTTRLTLAIYAVTLLVGLITVHANRKSSIQTTFRHLGAYAVPVVIGIGLQLTYNYARFGSPWSYFPESNPETARWLPVFSLERVPDNIRHYLFAVPEFSTDFPWVAHRGWQPIGDVRRAESMSSMFLGTPVLLLAGLAPSLFRRKPAHAAQLKLAAALAAGSGLLVFGAMLMFHSASRRYMQDFTPMFLIVAFLGVASRWKEGGNWKAWRAPALALLAYMIVFHAHLAFMHSFEWLPTDLNVVRAVAQFSPVVRRVLPGPNLDREEAIARNDLGTLYLTQRRFQEALDQFEKAGDLMPNSELIQTNLRLARRLTEAPDTRQSGP